MAQAWPRMTPGRPARPGERIGAQSVLPALRRPVTLHTADGLALEGVLDLPASRPPVATLVCVHPLPTHGGTLDSHLLRKAGWRLPALADLAVLRFNTRGTGASEGRFDGGAAERFDLAAALDLAEHLDLPAIWLLGWSFGSEVVLLHGHADPAVAGGILLSPPLRRAGDADLDAWAASGKPLLALVPELDDYLRPDQARLRFARVPQAQVVPVAGARHLWVGEPAVRAALSAIIERVNPAALPLPTTWHPEEPT